MSTPYSSGRDDNVGTGNAFDVEADVADEHLAAFQSSFMPPTDQLSEQDYRGPEQGGSGFETVAPRHESAEAPSEFGYPTPKPGGFVNLP